MISSEVSSLLTYQVSTSLLLSICLWEITDIYMYFSCHRFSYCGAICFHRQRALITWFPQAIWIILPQDPSAGMTCMSFLSLFNKLLTVMKKKKYYIEHLSIDLLHILSFRLVDFPLQLVDGHPSMLEAPDSTPSSTFIKASCLPRDP